mmetsp:Transcript_88383/g.249008  ORF Transcript_88383/g.249008 Transcript_88383/m.249008 type:complete len:354 (+) Transcript_88383:147-1208(+)
MSRGMQLLDVQIRSMGLRSDSEARSLLRRALRDAWPAARKFGWQFSEVRELAPEDNDVGYMGEDNILYVKLRDPSSNCFYPYSFVLATLLHELSHLSYLGHGKAFYRRFAEALDLCGAEQATMAEVRSHACAELLNAVCENDARRARALLAVLPEAANHRCYRPGATCSQLPLEYAAHHGRVALTKLLLEARADAGASSGEGSMPPILRAMACGNAKTARVLLEARANATVDALAASKTPLQVRDATPLKLTGMTDPTTSVSTLPDPLRAPLDAEPPRRDGVVAGRKKRRSRSRASSVMAPVPSTVPRRAPSGLPAGRKSLSLPALPNARADGEPGPVWLGRRGTTLSGSLAL